MPKIAVIGSQLAIARAVSIMSRAAAITVEGYEEPFIPEQPPAPPSKEEFRPMKASIARHEALRAKSRVRINAMSE